MSKPKNYKKLRISFVQLVMDKIIALVVIII